MRAATLVVLGGVLGGLTHVLVDLGQRWAEPPNLGVASRSGERVVPRAVPPHSTGPTAPESLPVPPSCHELQEARELRARLLVVLADWVKGEPRDWASPEEHSAAEDAVDLLIERAVGAGVLDHAVPDCSEPPCVVAGLVSPRPEHAEEESPGTEQDGSNHAEPVELSWFLAMGIMTPPEAGRPVRGMKRGDCVVFAISEDATRSQRVAWRLDEALRDCLDVE